LPNNILETREAFLDFVNRNVSPLLHYTHGKDMSSNLHEEIENYFNMSKRKSDKLLCEYTKKKLKKITKRIMS